MVLPNRVSAIHPESESNQNAEVLGFEGEHKPLWYLEANHPLLIGGYGDNFEKVAETVQNVSSSNNIGASKTVFDNTKKSENFVVRTDEESISKGKILFEKVCKKCHDAYSTTNIRGPGLKGILKRDVMPFSKKPATAENILNQLNRPFGKMPSFHFLSEEEKLNIIAFLNTL